MSKFTQAIVKPHKGRWIALFALTLTALVSTPAVAAVEPGDSVYIGDSTGYPGVGFFPVWETTPADPSNPGPPTFWAYCIENRITPEVRTMGVVGDLNEFLGSNYFTDPNAQSKVLWVLANSFPAVSLADFGDAVGVPGISFNDAVEATQYAIWRYTDLNFDAPWSWETPESEAAYWYLVNGANASSGLTPADFELSVTVTAPATTQQPDSLIGPFTVATNRPSVSIAANQTVVFTDASGIPIDTSSVVDGQQVYVDFRGNDAAGSVTVTATAVGMNGTGRIINVPSPTADPPTAADHGQTVILVAPDTARTTATASVSWSAAATGPMLAESGFSPTSDTALIAGLVFFAGGAFLLVVYGFSQRRRRTRA